MGDEQQSTPWKVALVRPLSDGAVVLLSSGAHPSQIIGIRPKIESQNSSKERPQGWYGWRWGPSRYGAHYNFGYFLPVTQHETLMHWFGGLGPSKWLLSWGLLGSFVFIWALGWVQQSTGVE
jgi:hypothetical protein